MGMSSIKKSWILKQTILRAALVCFAGAMSLAQAQQQRETAKPRTKLIVLGVVDHSGQLVSPMNSPGMLAAFIDKVHPDAICIERPPEEASRNDYTNSPTRCRVSSFPMPRSITTRSARS